MALTGVGDEMLTEWVRAFADGAGYGGFFLLMLLQDVFPPLPSELIMAMAGFAASKGELSLVGVTAACALGSLVGMLFWYAVGRWVGVARLKAFAARHGRWLTLTPEDIDRVDDWFERYGVWAVSLGRALPMVGVLISVPAGMMRMPLARFMLFSGVFNAGYISAVVGAGYWLGEQQWQRVEAVLGGVSGVFLAFLVVGYAWRVWRFGRRTA